MKNLKIIRLVFFCILFAGCEKEERWDCLKSTGASVSEERTITGFSKIQLHDNINLVLTQDTVNRLTIEVGKNLLPSITTEVDNETLIIKNENRCNWVRSFKRKITAHLSFKSLNNLTCYGSGNVNMTNVLNTDTLRIEFWEATGSIFAEINCNYSYFILNTGPGDLTINGESKQAFLYNAGNGWMYLNRLSTKKFIANNLGTGDVFVRSSEALHAEIRGIGNIYYSGSPILVTSKITGEGKLIKKE